VARAGLALTRTLGQPTPADAGEFPVEIPAAVASI
jgi:hypothetical protein